MLTQEDKDHLKNRFPIAGFGVGAATGAYLHETNRLTNTNNRALKVLNKVRKSRIAAAAMPTIGGYAAYRGTVAATGKRMSPNKERMIGTLTGGTIGAALTKAVLKKSNTLKTGLGAAGGSLAGGLIAAVNMNIKRNKANKQKQIAEQQKYNMDRRAQAAANQYVGKGV